MKKDLKEKVAEIHDLKKLLSDNEEMIKELKKKLKHLEGLKFEIAK